MGRLDGRVAVITGGARGQGAAEGRRFVDEGAVVYLTDVLADEGQETAAAIGATFLVHDVARADSWAAVVDRVVADHGRVDVLVNNAGILRWLTMQATPVEEWDRIVAVNQTGVFLGMQAVAPAMVAQRSGSIINVASIGGLRGSSPCFAYGTTKWAVRGMTKGAAQELGPHGVRANCILPGVVDTPMLVGFPIAATVQSSVPLDRAGEPDDIARVAAWLASDEASYVTGAEIVVDGGLTA